MESGKAEANQNLRKDRRDKQNIPPTTTTTNFDWLPLFRFPLFCQDMNSPLDYPIAASAHESERTLHERF